MFSLFLAAFTHTLRGLALVGRTECTRPGGERSRRRNSTAPSAISAATSRSSSSRPARQDRHPRILDACAELTACISSPTWSGWRRSIPTSGRHRRPFAEVRERKDPKASKRPCSVTKSIIRSSTTPTAKSGRRTASVLADGGMIDPEGFVVGRLRRRSTSTATPFRSSTSSSAPIGPTHAQQEADLLHQGASGEGIDSPLWFPGKVLADGASNRLFIADSTHHRIVVTDLEGKKLAIAGTGKAGHTDGAFEQASFNDPQGMALDGDILYVADRKNHLIRAARFEEARSRPSPASVIRAPISAAAARPCAPA